MRNGPHPRAAPEPGGEVFGVDRPDDPQLEPQQDHQRAASLRVSDADRDQAATELGEHFQAGRLDQDEFDERLTAALRARTRGELDQLLDDLPAARRPDPPLPSGPAASGSDFRPLLALIPLLLVVVVMAASRGQHDGSGAWPLLWLWWLIIASVVFRMRRGWRPGGPGPRGGQR
jgi:uncharacterized protein DUF1707